VESAARRVLSHRPEGRRQNIDHPQQSVPQRDPPGRRDRRRAPVSAVHDFSATQPVLPDDVELTAGEIGDVRAAALSTIVATGVSGVLLLAVTADGNLLETTGRSGQWPFFAQVIAGIVGQPVPADAIDVSLARTGIVLVTGDGRVWLATYLPNDPNNRLSSWQDLELSNVGLTKPARSATPAARAATTTAARPPSPRSWA